MIADLEFDSYERVSGLRSTMMLSDGWDELLVLPEMDVDKAIVAGRQSGGNPIPREE